MKKLLKLIAGAVLIFPHVAHAEFNKKDIFCLADNAFYEARNQGVKGMKAVIDVTLNRVKSKKYPDSVCEVVYQRKQFSWTHQTRQKVTTKELENQYITALQLAASMSLGYGRGITHGSLWYHEQDILPKWAKSQKLKRVKQIKQHIFYASN